MTAEPEIGVSPDLDDIEEGVRRLHRSGFHVVPLHEAKKRAAVRWRKGPADYVVIQPSGIEVEKWLQYYATWAILCGGPMRIVCIDVEAKGMAHPVIRAVVMSFPESCRRPSPSGGMHVWVVLTDGDVPRSTKLARGPKDANGKPVLWAEIKGHGGYAGIVGPGRGDLPEDWQPFKMTADEFAAAIEPIRALDHRPVAPPRPARSSESNGKSATADYLLDLIGKRPELMVDLLDPGWEITSEGLDSHGERMLYLKRPDYDEPTDNDHSAVVFRSGVFLNWSSSVHWWPDDYVTEDGAARGMAPGKVLALAQFGDDFHLAMQAVEFGSVPGIDPPHPDLDDAIAGILTGIEEQQGEGEEPAQHDGTIDKTVVGSSNSAHMLPDEFWCTDELRAIRQAAHSRQLGAAGLLGAVLARVALLTHYTVELPNLRNRGSLNVFVGLVVESGGGKGSSTEVAAELLPHVEMPCACGNPAHLGDYITQPPGTGEGLSRMFWDNCPTGIGRAREWQRDRRHVLVDVDEIETLIAIMGRSGSTIGPTLRTLWSGGTSGFNNSSADRRFPLTAGSYRLALVAGVQPEIVGTLFGESMGGTPQRFLWLPAHALDIPDLDAGESLPPFPKPLRPLAIGPIPGGIKVDREVRNEVELRRNRVGRRVEKRDRLDAHRDFLMLRVAAYLARLHHGTEVTTFMWRLAGMVMDVSDQTRSGMLAVSRAQEAQRDRAAGARAAARSLSQDAVIQSVVTNSAQSIWRTVKNHTQDEKHSEGACARRCLVQAVAGKYGSTVRENAVAHALAHDWISEDDGRYRLGDSQPAAGGRKS